MDGKLIDKVDKLIEFIYLIRRYFYFDELDRKINRQKIGYLFRHYFLDEMKVEKEFLDDLDLVKNKLDADIEIIKLSDPSINHEEEILLAYPGFFALLFYRISHLLFIRDFKFEARVISEYAHSKTGIDIHPGAEIEEGVFIDHGSGVVIGETSLIEKGVKIYQGVTLGASNLSKGCLLKGIKRHPTIKRNVTLYADCKILGGETVIGENTIISSGVIITKSIDSNKVVYCENNLLIKEKINE